MTQTVQLDEATWVLLKERAAFNGLTPNEEIVELIRDAEYASVMGGAGDED